MPLRRKRGDTILSPNNRHDAVALRKRGIDAPAAFFATNRVQPARLADSSSVSRQHIYPLKKGEMEPTRPLMLWLTEAACCIVKRRVEVAELFDFYLLPVAMKPATRRGT